MTNSVQFIKFFLLLALFVLSFTTYVSGPNPHVLVQARTNEGGWK